MKIRNGFVSNSSSSSFVLIGVERKSNITDYEMKLALDNFDISYTNNYEDLFFDKMCDEKFGISNPNETNLWGEYIASFSDDGDYMPQKQLSIDQINEIRARVKANLVKMFGEEIEDSEVKLFTGTSSC